MTKNNTYNIDGHNARVNINSTDNSTNIVNNHPDITDSLLKLREELQALVKEPAQQKDALEVVDHIEAQLQSASPSKAVLSALIKSLPSVGSVAAIGSFILSCLAG